MLFERERKVPLSDKMVMPHSLHWMLGYVPLPVLRMVVPAYGAACSFIYPRLQRREFQANLIVPGLYLGNVHDAWAIEGLRQRNITHVVTAVVGLQPMYPNDFKCEKSAFLNICLLFETCTFLSFLPLSAIV